MKTKIKQLSLSKETVKTLNQEQMAQANGGTMRDSNLCKTSITCRTRYTIPYC